jgi:uncharacterized Zn finger protein
MQCPKCGFNMHTFDVISCGKNRGYITKRIRDSAVTDFQIVHPSYTCNCSSCGAVLFDDMKLAANALRRR